MLRVLTFLLLALVAASDIEAAGKERATWLLDADKDRIAFVRMIGDLWGVMRPAELRIVHRQPVTPEGADVLLLSFDVNCPDARSGRPTSATFRSGELWIRSPARLLGELTNERFESLNGDAFLADLRLLACWTPAFRDLRSGYIKAQDHLFTQTYFKLIDAGLTEYEAIILASLPRDYTIPKGRLHRLGVAYEHRDAALAILEERKKFPTDAGQAAP